METSGFPANIVGEATPEIASDWDANMRSMLEAGRRSLQLHLGQSLETWSGDVDGQPSPTSSSFSA